MNTRERVEIVKTNYPSPNQVLLIFLVVLASFAMGLIPIVYGLGSPDTKPTTIPSEAGLWSVFGDSD